MSKPKRVTFAPRRFVRDRDIHNVDSCLLSGRQLVLRRQQSQRVILDACSGPEPLAALIQKAADISGVPNNSTWPTNPPLSLSLE